MTSLEQKTWADIVKNKEENRCRCKSSDCSCEKEGCWTVVTRKKPTKKVCCFKGDYKDRENLVLKMTLFLKRYPLKEGEFLVDYAERYGFADIELDALCAASTNLSSELIYQDTLAQPEPEQTLLITDYDTDEDKIYYNRFACQWSDKDVIAFRNSRKNFELDAHKRSTNNMRRSLAKSLKLACKSYASIKGLVYELSMDGCNDGSYEPLDRLEGLNWEQSSKMDKIADKYREKCEKLSNYTCAKCFKKNDKFILCVDSQSIYCYNCIPETDPYDYYCS